jgi:hypothetical protein
MRKKNLITGIGIILLFVSSFLFANEKPTKNDVPKLPENVKVIIDKSCFGCHNTGSRNEDAKEELDFKKFDGLSVMKQISAYKHIGEVLEKNEMPPKKFLDKRPEKKLTDKEKEVLIAWAKKEAEALVKSK